MLYCLIALDTGGETGLSFAIYNPKAKGSSDHHIRRAMAQYLGDAIQFGGEPNLQTVTFLQHLVDIKKKATSASYDTRYVVACEDFVLPSRSMRNSVLLSPKIAAKMEYATWLDHEDVEWRWQMPGERLVITQEMLGKWGLWQPGKKHDDAMAALQHLFLLGRRLEREDRGR